MAATVNFDEVDNTPLMETDLLVVLEEVDSLKSCADDLGIALKLSPSFCISSKGVELKAVILEWLKQQGGVPSWRSLVEAVKSPVGGKNLALAKRIARKHMQKKGSAPVPVSSSVPVSSPVPATGYGETVQQQQPPYSFSTNVSTPSQEERSGSNEAKLVFQKHDAPALAPSMTTGTTLSSRGDLDSVLSVSTSAVNYATQSSQDSNLSSSHLVSGSVPVIGRQVIPDSSVSRVDPTRDQESNPPSVPDQPSETAELDTSHTEEDVVSPATNNARMLVGHNERLYMEDGGNNTKDKLEECDAQHEEEDISVYFQLRHVQDDSGQGISAWVDSIKQRQRRLKYAEDDNPYCDFMKPYPVVAYPKKRGLAIVINIANVVGSPFRSGSKEDERNLCKLFDMLRYDVEVRVDLTSNDIRQLFTELQKANFQDHDSFVCCILTHGTMDYFTCQDIILGADGSSLTVKDLKEHIIANNSLNGKPKLFFIQACRGNQFKLARLVKSDGPGDGPDDELGDPKTYIDDRQRIRPYYSDVFVGYATTPGTKASRDSHNYKEGDIKGQAGSWYIIELCSVLTTLYKTHDLITMVTIVHDILARDSRYLKAINKAKGQWYRQAPQFESTLTRPFFFELETSKAGSVSEKAGIPEQAKCTPEP